MKKFLLLGFFMLPFLNSCSLFDNLIPDVDTSYSETFTIYLNSSSGETEKKLVDVTSSEDYEDFEDNIDGYKITSVKYEIFNYYAPDDLYLNGDIMVGSHSGGQETVAAKISRFKLSDQADTGQEYESEEMMEGLKKIRDWLNSPGNFYIWADYLFTDGSGNEYNIENGSNYYFNLEITIYVTVETGI